MPPLNRAWMDASMARDRFERSEWVARIWPSELRDATLASFEMQQVINRATYGISLDRRDVLEAVHQVLTRSHLRSPVLWLIASDGDLQRLLEALPPAEQSDANVQVHLGIGALADRAWKRAALHFERAAGVANLEADAELLLAYSLAMAGESQRALQLARQIAQKDDPATLRGRRAAWLIRTFDPGGTRPTGD